MDGGIVTVFIELPAVYKDVFEQYFVVPMPQSGTRKIGKIKHQTIVMNQQIYNNL